MTTKPQYSTQGFHWQPNKNLLLLSCCLFPLLVGLGFWQLDRAEEKRRIVEQYRTNQQATPATVAELIAEDSLQYRSAWLKGQLDAQRRLILDNRVKNGRPGYEILEPLRVDGLDQTILVNRGWVSASLDRTQLPQVEPVTATVQLRGSLYQSLGGYHLDDGFGLVSHGEDFFPYQLRLDQDSPGALQTGWATVSVQPAKHTGYAVQWFVMALVLLLMTVIANSNLAEWLKQRTAK